MSTPPEDQQPSEGESIASLKAQIASLQVIQQVTVAAGDCDSEAKALAVTLEIICRTTPWQAGRAYVVDPNRMGQLATSRIDPRFTASAFTAAPLPRPPHPTSATWIVSLPPQVAAESPRAASSVVAVIPPAVFRNSRRVL